MITKVKTVEYAGSTWQNKANGETMYNINVSFENGWEGQASAKTEQPWYNVGDEVNVEVTRENEYGKSFKIGKPGYAGGAKPAGNGAARPAGAPQRSGYVAKDNSFDIRVGRCINNAVLLHCYKSSHGLSIVDLADKLFKDELELIKRHTPAPAPAPQPQQAPRPQQAPQPTQQEPEYPAQEEADERLPF